MKKILLLTLSLLLIGQLNAQNWRPFNPSDTVRHYLAEDSTDRHITFYPIISTVIDTAYLQNNQTLCVFSKGFSYLKAHRDYTYSSYANKAQMVKGKILGDTAVFYLDSTVIKSIDSIGFTLNFPTTYNLGDSWEIARSDSQNLRATVDSIYFDSIPNFSNDSMISIQLSATDLNGNPLPHSPFNKSIVLSKSHGLIKTIDFTDLDSAFVYELYAWQTQDKKYIKQGEVYQLNPGDFYFSQAITSWGIPHGYKYTVVSDSFANGRRFINYQIDSLGLSLNSLYNQLYYSTRGTKTETLVVEQDSNLYLKHSGVFHDSLSAVSSNNPYAIYPQFGLHAKLGAKWPVKLEDYNLQNKTLWALIFGIDFIEIDIFERDILRYPLLGVGPEKYVRTGGSPGIFYDSENIFFVSKGGQTWGIQPIPFVVSLNEVEKENQFSIFPNPTTETLFISDAKKITQIRIFDQSGRQVKQWDNPRNKLNIGELPNGLYFISLQTQTGELINQKFVKQ